MPDASAARESVAAPKAIYLKDYEPPAFRVEAVALEFDLEPGATRVQSRLEVVRQQDGAPLTLDGEGMELVAVKVNGKTVGPDGYLLTDKALIIEGIGDKAVIETEAAIDPAGNTALEGLYMSRGRFFTQCEAEGFRKIAYFPDRPDVMARFSVMIRADKAAYPVLLSNGNLVGAGESGDGRHWAKWDDPFPKPCYLFALVAGSFACLEDSFRTRSGRDVALRIYAEERDLDKCGHAMESLKNAMRWDEEVFGLEYDLDIYNIVAVSDFNMGAMENKSLNIFNTKCVLAKAETATDADFAAVEGVIAHEYFHNWTGNRVTCRDWFQLSLKEGLTVFRDQQFSADMGSAAVQRIEDVQTLRAHQFPEDAGPLAHPVRPDSYIEINNFYTATIYEKGAEVIRMMHRLVGPENFRKGMDLYFKRHDGQAVTCDDFVAAMADASGVDLGQFKLWYHQAGTPHLTVTRDWDGDAGEYRLTITQATRPTPGQPEKKPLHIPVAVGLLGADGHALDFEVEGNEGGRPDADGTFIFNLRKQTQSFVIKGLKKEPIPSVLRGFSAPVWVDAGLSHEELRFLMAHDTDLFNRWEAGQKLADAVLLDMVKAVAAGKPTEVSAADLDAFAALAADESADKALLAKALTLPGESYLAQRMEVVDVDAIHIARTALRRQVGKAFRGRFETLYDANRGQGGYRFDAGEVARRSLRNTALTYLMAADPDAATDLCLQQLDQADNMTDEAAALVALAHSERPQRDGALQRFFDKWRNEDLVVDKWFSIQATAPAPDTMGRVEALLAHPAFTLKTPNRARALIGAFTQNQVRFHDASGRGYRFLTDQVAALNAINPQVAARMLTPLGRWQRFDSGRQKLMKAELKRLLEVPDLSPDVFEVASKSLESEP